MSTNVSFAYPASPPHDVLSSPHDVTQAHLPLHPYDTSLTPRVRSRLNTNDSSFDDAFASPRRIAGGQHVLDSNGFSSISQTFDEASLHDTPKIAAAPGVGSSAPEIHTPGRGMRGIMGFSSPMQSTVGRDPLRGVHIPGYDDAIYGTSLSAPHTPFGYGQTFHHSPMVSSSTVKRHLAGLGSPTPHATAKRQRQATMGSASSVPPSPLSKRQRQSSGATLMTLRPLERTASGPPAVGGLMPTMDRNVSGISMTSSTSTELLSPALQPYSSFHGVDGFTASFSAPQLTGDSFLTDDGPQSNSAPGSGTIAPSALLPDYNLPPAPFTSSPEVMQDGFSLNVQQANLNVGMSTMSSATPSPVPTAMSVLQQQQAQAFSVHERQSTQERQTAHAQTLDTILESDFVEAQASYTPALDFPGTMPAQEMLGGDGFLQMAYPPVPGMSYNPTPDMSRMHSRDNSNASVSSWNQNLQMYNQGPAMGGFDSNQVSSFNHFGYAQPPGMPMQRATSMSYGPMGHPNPNFLASRSASMPQVPRAMEGANMAGMHASMQDGQGSFGPGPSLSMAQMPMGATMPDGAPFMGENGLDSAPPLGPYASTTTSPDTPTKKKVHPTVGKRLKPGPKPRSLKTPSTSGAKSSPDLGTVQPSDVFPPQAAYEDDAPLNSSKSTSPSRSGQSGQSSYSHSIGSGSMPERIQARQPLDFGPSLTAVPGMQQQHFQHASQYPHPHQHQLQLQHPMGLMGPAHPHAHSYPQPQPYGPPQPHASGSGSGIGMQSGNSQGAPTLVMDAVRVNAPEPNASGLPKNFIDGLYKTVLTMEGSTNGNPVKKFECLIEGCSRTFPRKSAIGSHIQTHLDDKPFRCSDGDCNAAFVRQHDLRRHQRIHTGRKPFPCTCGKGFARGDALHRHRQRNICQGGLDRGNGRD